MRKKANPPLAVKNWSHIRSVAFSEGCPTNYSSDEKGNFVWAACPEGEGTCSITITHSDGSTQTHVVRRGGGVVKQGDTVEVKKDGLKCE